MWYHFFSFECACSHVLPLHGWKERQWQYLAILEQSSERQLFQPMMHLVESNNSMTSKRERDCMNELLARSEKRQKLTLVPLMLQRLSIMSVNIQFCASFPTDQQKRKQSLQERFGQTHLPDVICMQKGMVGMEEMKDMGYQLVICAGTQGVAQSVDEMIYHDQEALETCRRDQSHKPLCNQVYMRTDSKWKVEASGVEQISSALELAGGGGRKTGWLAVRSMCWLVLSRHDSSKPAVCVMYSHLSGGRLEDQYFVQQLERERYSQIERCIVFYHTMRRRKQNVALGILVGDFNATRTYTVDDPMKAYFKSAITTSQGVWLDARSHHVETEEALEHKFERYIVSPFEALNDWNWLLPYDEEEDEATSVFGHPVDYMAVSSGVVTNRPRRVILNDEKVNGKQTDTAVTTSFFV